MNNPELTDLVIAALRDVFETSGEDGSPRLPEAGSETRLIGDGSALTSMQLVSLLVEIEQRIEETLGVSVTIADERALSMKRSPFRSVGTLVEYLELLMAESKR